MRVMIIADESFATRERAMLFRLEVGLADEGVRVIHAVPGRVARAYQPESFSQVVPYESRGLAISRSWRARQLLAAARGDRDAEGGAEPDVVHAFGTECWALATEVARQAEAALALEIDSAEAAAMASRLRPSTETGPAVRMLPDPALERAARGDAVGVQTRVTPWGVHTPPASREILTPGRGVSVMIAGSGRDPMAMAAALEALAAIATQVSDLLIFVDGAAAERSGAWAIAERLKLTGRFTLAPDMEARRELALRGDVLLLPEVRGEQRSLTLDAMACGMLVVAATDPLVSVLVDGRTARLSPRPGTDAWREVLGWALTERVAARSLAASGREHVRAQCRASTQVAAVVGAYEWMTAGPAIPFSPGAEVR